MKSGVTIKDNSKRIREAMQNLARERVLVGIPQAENSRADGTITNAELAYLHTNGSPANNIPARPFLVPSLQLRDNQILYTDELKEAGKSALEFNQAGTKQHLQLAGQIASNAAKRYFTDARNGWAPNSPVTIALKGSARPLIDTAQLRRAITWVLGRK